MNVMRWLDIARRWWWLVLACVLLAVAAGWLNGRRATPMYQATTRLIVNQIDIPGVSSYQDPLTIDRRARSYSEMLRSWPVLEEAVRRLDVALPVDALAERVSTRIVKDTQFLEVTVEDEDPRRAASLANTLAEVFIQRNRELQAGIGQDARQQIDQELDNTRAMIDDATRRLNALKATDPAGTAAAGELERVQGELAQYQQLYYQLLEIQQRMALEQARGGSTIAVVEPARAPVAPVGPGVRQKAIIAGLAGLLLAIGLVVGIEFLDDRIRDPRELRDRLKLVPLAVLGRRSRAEREVLDTPEFASKSTFAEALRLLRTNLEFLSLGRPMVLAISSALEGEGKSTVAANLAVTEAQAGKRVVLIDGDLRKPSLHRLFGLPNTRGLSTFLARAQNPDQPPFHLGPLGVRILTSGPIPPNPSELLGSPRMAELVNSLRAQADVVIIDCVPILPVADTLVLQRHTDGIVLVLDSSNTGVKTVGRALDRLQQVSANVFGVVLNKDRRRAQGYYGYDHSTGAGGRRADRPPVGQPAIGHSSD